MAIVQQCIEVIHKVNKRIDLLNKRTGLIKRFEVHEQSSDHSVTHQGRILHA